jgi:hypothetical protein
MHFFYREVRDKFPDLHKHKRMNFGISALNGTFFPKESEELKKAKKIYIVGEVDIQIEKKKILLSEYITWANQDGKTDPLEQLKNSTIIILHQDAGSINSTLDEIAKVFDKALKWTPQQKEQVLKNHVAFIRYLFAHAMPYQRGSAAIAEWLERAIYASHGFECTHSGKTMGDMEAFIAPTWDVFEEKYAETVTLTKVKGKKN